MSKCRNCGKHGLFLMVNIHTGLCSECQKKYETEQTSVINATPEKSNEQSIEIPTVCIGNNMKYKLIERFEDVELQRPANMPNFSKINCCDDVDFAIENDIIIAKHYTDIIGYIADTHIVIKIKKSLEKKLPIFSQILGYDDETGEIHLVIALYKIVNYDYTDYVQDRDDSLEYETVRYI